ncbi:MAG TPA: Maf family protein, partial [Gemmatimonadaceae bacterium]|nr:Maf family protein [Gemmatimonadaceae bacterium]
MSAPRIVLASGSPRRRQLLDMIGIAHDVAASDIDESMHPGEFPPAYAERVAREKGDAIAVRAPGVVVVSADTIVVVDGEVLGKPVDAADAARMLWRLSGRDHLVYTAVSVRRGGHIESGVEEVAVTFRELSDADVARYVATGEPMDKAGAYGIQGFGATIVRRIDGDYFAVMGLPLGLLVRLLARVGVRYTFGAPLEDEWARAGARPRPPAAS